jgi:CBS-domain-containing membrane protein
MHSIQREIAMSTSPLAEQTTSLVLNAETAADLMTHNPISIRDSATVVEAVACLTDRCISAAPVIDQAGRPVGVVSCSDLLVHYREREARTMRSGVPVSEGEIALVRDVMTPSVFGVSPRTTARQVNHEMSTLNIHHLFVVDSQGILLGTISTLDVLRHLQ